MTPQQRLQRAAQSAQIAARLAKEAQAQIWLALKQIAQQKADTHG